MNNNNLTYRPDIDGLRAIAVLLVVLNHVGFSAFSGGFIGVDVFFVISGYLITGIILSQISKDAFSFTDFYLRRAKRILPALYVVLLAVMIAGYLLYIPSDYSVLSQSTLSAIAFVSNIFFWKNSGGYFSSSAEEMPLLHIWSLSVEEQFYFIWPLALVLILKLKTQAARFTVISAILIASFTLAEIGVRHSWAGTYFLLPSRAGELLVGALLAFWLSKRHSVKASNIMANALSLAGLFMVLIPAVLLGKTSGFPGINALIPCVGAGLIIASGALGQSVVSRILASRPFVFIGLISYSLYLWHWPLISFLHYSRIEITTEIALGLVFSSIALGYLSWRFIEQTFRHNSKPKRKGFAVATVLSGILLAVFPVVVYLKEGIPSRFPYALLTQEQLTAERGRYWHGIKTTAEFDNSIDLKKVVVIGNSHAYDFSYALTENGFKGQIKLLETSFYCFNFSNNYVFAAKAEECKSELKIVLEAPELKTAETIYLHDDWGGKNLGGLTEVIKKIRNITSAPIFVIGPKMIFTDTALNISKEAQIKRHVTASSINKFARNFEVLDRVKYDKELKEFFTKENFKDVKYVSALDVQCGEDLKCDILSESGEYLYFDQGHFTLAGSKIFGKKLREENNYLF